MRIKDYYTSATVQGSVNEYKDVAVTQLGDNLELYVRVLSPNTNIDPKRDDEVTSEYVNFAGHTKLEVGDIVLSKYSKHPGCIIKELPKEDVYISKTHLVFRRNGKKDCPIHPALLILLQELNLYKSNHRFSPTLLPVDVLNHHLDEPPHFPELSEGKVKVISKMRKLIALENKAQNLKCTLNKAILWHIYKNQPLGSKLTTASPISVASDATLVNQKFIERMESELQDNQRKGDWKNWRPDTAQALSELDHHVSKLKMALQQNNAHQVSEYSADTANIAMKIAEEFGDV